MANKIRRRARWETDSQAMDSPLSQNGKAPAAEAASPTTPHLGSAPGCISFVTELMARLATEEIRLQALQSYELLDAPPDPRLDELVALCGQLLQAPIALLSLVDAERLVFKVHHGIEAVETRREGSPCAAAILEDRLFVVEDAAADHRFAAHPLVAGPPHIRFCAAMPLITPRRAALGTLCIADVRPRSLTAVQAEALRVLSAQLMNLLEDRRIALVRDCVLQAIDRELHEQVDVLRRLAAAPLSQQPRPGSSESGRAVQLLSAIEHMDANIDSIGDLVRFGLGQPLELQPERMDLVRLCREVIEELAAGLGVQFDFTSSGDCKGRWDPGRLTQAALLLFEEARNRSEANGRVRVVARGEGENVLLQVSIPITPGEPGLRIHLGRELVRALGGKVDFAIEDERATFFVTLPRDPPF